jgi:hypothetical protein
MFAAQAAVAPLSATEAAERPAAEAFPGKEAGVARRQAAEEFQAWAVEVGRPRAAAEAARRLAA